MFGTEEKCYEYLVKARWKEGFVYPNCSHTHGYFLKNKRYQCSSCRK
ncbi:MAG: transposase [Eubacteriales bacterium]